MSARPRGSPVPSSAPSPGGPTRRALLLAGGGTWLAGRLAAVPAPPVARPGPLVLVPWAGGAAEADLRADPASGVGPVDLDLHLAAPDGSGDVPEGARRLDLEGRAARDPELERRVRAARHLRLSGGDLAGWWSALFPRDEASPVVRALHRAWRAGASLTGVGAGGAFLAGGGSAVHDAWPWTERDPHARALRGRALVGLGWAPLPLLGRSAEPVEAVPLAEADPLPDGVPEEPGRDAPSRDVAAPAPAAERAPLPADGSVEALLDAVQRHDLEAVAWFAGDALAVHRPTRRATEVRGSGRLRVLYLDGVARGLRRVRAGRLLDLTGGCVYSVADGRLRILTDSPPRTHAERGLPSPPAVRERHGAHALDLRADERTRTVVEGPGAGSLVERHATLRSPRVPVRRD